MYSNLLVTLFTIMTTCMFTVIPHIIKLCPMSMVYHICLCLTKAINFRKLYYYYTGYIYLLQHEAISNNSIS